MTTATAIEASAPNATTVHGPANDQRKRPHVGENALAKATKAMACNAGSHVLVTHPGNRGLAHSAAEFVPLGETAAAMRGIAAWRMTSPANQANPMAIAIAGQHPPTLLVVAEVVDAIMDSLLTVGVRRFGSPAAHSLTKSSDNDPYTGGDLGAQGRMLAASALEEPSMLRVRQVAGFMEDVGGTAVHHLPPVVLGVGTAARAASSLPRHCAASLALPWASYNCTRRSIASVTHNATAGGMVDSRSFMPR